MHRKAMLFALFGLALAITGCGRSSASDQPRNRSEGSNSIFTCGSAPGGKITVAAAASLTESLTEIGQDFEDQCPGTEITLTFDSSGSLARQIIDGAPADIFASADGPNMERLAAKELNRGDPTTFARNQLAIVTQPGNPEGIRSLADLRDVGIVSLCADDAPCGALAAEVLDRTGVSIPETSITRGQNAKATLAAVSEGDAVAGVVYASDARAAGDAVGPLSIPDDQNAVVTYPAVVLASAPTNGLPEAFIAYLSSDAAQAVLAGRGFLPPT